MNVAIVAAACDAYPSRTAQLLGLTREPDWASANCAPLSQRMILDVPAERYWSCRTDDPDGWFRVDWWREAAVAGERTFSEHDSLGWTQLRDSIRTALGQVAARGACSDRADLVTADGPAVPHDELELWNLEDERRWVAVSAEWHAAWVSAWRKAPAWGTVRIETDTGSLATCDAYRRLRDVSLN